MVTLRPRASMTGKRVTPGIARQNGFARLDGVSQIS
jgi:hypothetical protein